MDVICNGYVNNVSMILKTGKLTEVIGLVLLLFSTGLLPTRTIRFSTARSYRRWHGQQRRSHVFNRCLHGSHGFICSGVAWFKHRTTRHRRRPGQRNHGLVSELSKGHEISHDLGCHLKKKKHSWKHIWNAIAIGSGLFRTILLIHRAKTNLRGRNKLVPPGRKNNPPG